MPKIFIDADATPVAIKEILFRAAKRTGVEMIFIANHRIPVPSIPNVRSFQVSSGFDVADNEIVLRCEANDLVITNDIPLAAEVVDKNASVITCRGEVLDKTNVKARLNMRDFMDTMRASGEQTKGPPPLSNIDKKQFADKLDRWLGKAL